MKDLLGKYNGEVGDFVNESHRKVDYSKSLISVIHNNGEESINKYLGDFLKKETFFYKASNIDNIELSDVPMVCARILVFDPDN